MYGNYGGIGVTTDVHGVIDGLLGNERAVLSIRDCRGNVVTTISPPQMGWSNNTLIEALRSCSDYVVQHGVIEVLLGETSVGHTEL